MATVYSLVCFGGRTGKAVTISNATPAVVTLTNHGLRDGTGIVLSTTGALPTGLTAGTTYYAKSTASNTFNLYDTAAHAIAGGSTGRVNTSSAGSGTHTAKSDLIVNPSTRLAAYGLSDLSRWGSSGSERIYDGLVSWNATTVARESQQNDEVCEIGEAFTESFNSAGVSVVCQNKSTTIWTKINGIDTPAFHAGVIGAGYVLQCTYIYSATILALSKYRCYASGFTTEHTQNAGIQHLNAATSCEFRRMICKGYANSGMGYYAVTSQVLVDSCLFFNLNIGIQTPYETGPTNKAYVNNIITKCNYGFYASYADFYGVFVNNIAIGNNTADWGGTTPSAGSIEYASRNAGLSGQAWMKGTGATRITIATSDFVDWTNGDYRPAAVTSPQVSTAEQLYYNALLDLGNRVRPAYPGSLYGTTVTAGSFVAGLSYTIVSVGTTDFTLIGASANTVGVVFKATGVGSGTGTATLGALPDVGCYEYDLGYGSWPISVPVSITGLVSGSRVKIKKSSDGTELYNGVVTGDLSYSQTVGGDTPVKIYIRKGSAAPFYKPYYTTATISATTGLTLSVTQIADIAAGTYRAGIATDFSVNTSTLAISHVSGTTVYTVQELHSWLADYYDDSTTIDLTVPIDGTTSTIFTLINGATISDADHQYLNGGAITEASGNTLWANVYTVGTLTGSPQIYVYQNGSKLTSFWPTGHIDILVKVKTGGTLIDSGKLTIFAREYGKTYDHYLVDTSGGGRNVAPISTLSDANNTTTGATVAAYSGIGFSFGTYSLDFGDGGGAKGYKAKIDCNNLPLLKVYEYTKYHTQRGSVTSLNGVAGERYTTADGTLTEVKSAPFGTFAGGVWTLAPGVWLDNVSTSDRTNYIVTDTAGVSHQNVAPTTQSVTVSGMVVGSRLQIYDTTSSTELYNGVVATSTYQWTDSIDAVASRAIRVRIAYVSGTTAYDFVDQNVGTCGTTAGTIAVSYFVTQSLDAVYNANAIDGSAVTGITIDAATVRVKMNISAGAVTFPQIYAYQVYWQATATGIANETAFISASDTANYRFTSFDIKNIFAGPLVITGGYGVDASTGFAKDIIDSSGSTIIMAPDHVVPYQTTGTYAITGDISTVLAAIPSASATATAVLNAASSAPIHADTRKMNGANVLGNGSASDLWRGA